MSDLCGADVAGFRCTRAAGHAGVCVAASDAALGELHAAEIAGRWPHLVSGPAGPVEATVPAGTDVPAPTDLAHRCVALHPLGELWTAVCECGWSTDGHDSTAAAADAYGAHVVDVTFRLVREAIGRLVRFHGIVSD